MVETTSSIGPPQVNIEDEMRASYLDYAMSVIIGRALPDVRDGLKPVHRRILYAMYTEGLLHNRKYSKCAGVVGEVLKKYHPHGDAAVYDSLVRMAQPWNLRYPLVDGQGNFGSIDGDPAAAYRYTESRMEKLAEELLKDIEKDTADFIPNFDGATEEPTVLPSRLPNLLVNGSTGIAVGMATNIPPHNLREIIDATILLARNSEASIEEVMKLVPGPDFPTGGIIYGKEGINQAYRTGRGIVSVRGKAAIEVHPKTNRASIIVTEIPYQVNKARLIERIALLVRDKKLQGISDVRDESDRDGMRMVVDLKRDAVAQVVLNQLFKHTPLQNSFGIIMLAIVGGQPRVLNLKEAIGHYIDHRREVIRRRCVFELEQARARAHILEGLQIALDHIDEVIKIIRASKEPAVAKAGLIDRFELSAIQAQAILDMRLQKLTGLERDKIAAELAALRSEIDRLAAILEDVAKLMNVVIEELEEIREAYGDERRTDIVVSSEELSIEDLIADEEQMVAITHAGYIKRTALNLYRRQKRGGRGRTGMKARDEDFIEDVFVASTHSTIMVVTEAGRAYALKVHEVPEAGPTARGTAIVNLVRLRPDEAVASIVPIDSFEQEAEAFLVMVSAFGNIKKTALSAYANINVSGIIAMGVDEGDSIISAVLTSGSQELMITSRQGMAVRFREQNVRGMGRTARGVRGIKLREDDAVVSMEVVNPGATILTVTELGYGKRTELDEYRLTSRGGVGVKTCRITDRNGPVVDSMQVSADDDIIMITNGGMVVRTQVSGVSIMGRDTQGVRVINLKKGEHLVGLARLAEQDEEEEGQDKQGEVDGETEGGDEEA
ncbi:MAG: DNA gyrase subunit A [Deltaproteobacteria bacterium]|nr:DNA gyrase subunit A [Deltaproteobacteria bacterium]